MGGRTLSWANDRRTRLLWLCAIVMAAAIGAFLSGGQAAGTDTTAADANALVPAGWRVLPAQFAVVCGMTAVFGLGFLYLSERARPRSIRARRTSQR